MARRRHNTKQATQRQSTRQQDSVPPRNTIPEPAVLRSRSPLSPQPIPAEADAILKAIAAVEPVAVVVDTFDPCAEPVQFFVEEKDTIPPPVEMPDEEQARPSDPPHVIARRARLRKVVAAAVAAFGIFALVAAGKSIATRTSRSNASFAPDLAAVETRLAHQADPPAEPVQTAQPKVVEPPQAPAPPPGAEQAKLGPPSAEPQAPAQPVEEPAQERQVDAAEASRLKKEAESLLNRGRNAQAIDVSRAAIAADPTQAMPYLFLGTALQMTGKWKEGIEAYSECVRHATKGPVYECRAAGGKK